MSRSRVQAQTPQELLKSLQDKHQASIVATPGYSKEQTVEMNNIQNLQQQIMSIQGQLQAHMDDLNITNGGKTSLISSPRPPLPPIVPVSVPVSVAVPIPVQAMPPMMPQSLPMNMALRPPVRPATTPTAMQANPLGAGPPMLFQQQQMIAHHFAKVQETGQRQAQVERQLAALLQQRDAIQAQSQSHRSQLMSLQYAQQQFQQLNLAPQPPLRPPVAPQQPSAPSSNPLDSPDYSKQLLEQLSKLTKQQQQLLNLQQQRHSQEQLQSQPQLQPQQPKREFVSQGNTSLATPPLAPKPDMEASKPMERGTPKDSVRRLERPNMSQDLHNKNLTPDPTSDISWLRSDKDECFAQLKKRENAMLHEMSPGMALNTLSSLPRSVHSSPRTWNVRPLKQSNFGDSFDSLAIDDLNEPDSFLNMSEADVNFSERLQSRNTKTQNRLSKLSQA